MSFHFIRSLLAPDFRRGRVAFSDLDSRNSSKMVEFDGVVDNNYGFFSDWLAWPANFFTVEHEAILSYNHLQMFIVINDLFFFNTFFIKLYAQTMNRSVKRCERR